MEWQEYTAWAIVLLAVVTAVGWIVRLACGRRKGGCASCTAPCPLKGARSEKNG